MVMLRKGVFSLGGPERIADPADDLAVEFGRLALARQQAEAQNAMERMRLNLASQQAGLDADFRERDFAARTEADEFSRGLAQAQFDRQGAADRFNRDLELGRFGREHQAAEWAREHANRSLQQEGAKNLLENMTRLSIARGEGGGGGGGGGRVAQTEEDKLRARAQAEVRERDYLRRTDEEIAAAPMIQRLGHEAASQFAVQGVDAEGKPALVSLATLAGTPQDMEAIDAAVRSYFVPQQLEGGAVWLPTSEAQVNQLEQAVTAGVKESIAREWQRRIAGKDQASKLADDQVMRGMMERALGSVRRSADAARAAAREREARLQSHADTMAGNDAALALGRVVAGQQPAPVGTVALGATAAGGPPGVDPALVLGRLVQSGQAPALSPDQQQLFSYFVQALGLAPGDALRAVVQPQASPDQASAAAVLQNLYSSGEALNLARTARNKEAMLEEALQRAAGTRVSTPLGARSVRPAAPAPVAPQSSGMDLARMTTQRPTARPLDPSAGRRRSPRNR